MNFNWMCFWCKVHPLIHIWLKNSPSKWKQIKNSWTCIEANTIFLSLQTISVKYDSIVHVNQSTEARWPCRVRKLGKNKSKPLLPRFCVQNNKRWDVFIYNIFLIVCLYCKIILLAWQKKMCILMSNTLTSLDLWKHLSIWHSILRQST